MFWQQIANVQHKVPFSKENFLQFLSHFTTFFGYAAPNFAFYGEGGLIAADQIIKAFNGAFNLQENSLKLEDYFNDSAHIAAFIVFITALLCLSYSNQKVYADMTFEFLTKDNEENITAEEKNFKEKLAHFFEKSCNLIGTHLKVVVTAASLYRLLIKILKDPTACGLLSMLLVIPCGEFAQFSVLGRKHDFNIFKKGLYSFVESFVAGAIGYGIGMWANPAEAVLSAFIITGFTLLASTISIGATDKSLLISRFTTCFEKIKEIQATISNKLGTINGEGDGLLDQETSMNYGTTKA